MGFLLLLCQATLSYQDTSKQHVCGFKHQYNDVGILGDVLSNAILLILMLFGFLKMEELEIKLQKKLLRKDCINIV